MSNINVENKNIFIHIPKCGGSSMGSIKWNFSSGHETIFDIHKSKKLISLNINEFFKWCFVRNPWDRVVSAYEDCPEVFEKITTFEKLVYTLHKNMHEFKTLPHLHWGRDTHTLGLPVNRIHFYPMNLCMKYEGEIIMDFIGRFENIETDWIKIQNILAQPLTPLPKKNSRENKPKRRFTHYTELYTPQLKDLVGEIYEEDIQLFKYTFD